MTDHFAVLKAEVDGEPYRVEIPSKGKFEIPHVNAVDVFKMNDVVSSAETDLDVILATFELVMGAREFARLRKAGINRATLISLFVAWQQHCGLREGESPASSD